MEAGAASNLCPQLPGGVALAEVFQQLHEPWLVTDAQLDRPGPRILAANPAITQLTGYAISELIGLTPRLFQGPETERAVLDRLRAACAAGQNFTDEAVNYRKDGSKFIVEWSISPIRNADGEITHFLSIQRDVTDERTRLHQTNVAAREALSALSQQAAVLTEAILVLEKTKRSFKSTELARLRERLEAALATLRNHARST